MITVIVIVVVLLVVLALGVLALIGHREHQKMLAAMSPEERELSP